MTRQSFENDLLKENSLYLRQHAHNPVKWMAWGDEAIEKAQKEQKLIIVSIGYAACHWCHVMEKECFEDIQVAAIMNDFYTSIKVDREERPDIDQVYMDAAHLMNKQGGWPLNCIALPDGTPVFAGTYFPKQQWINVLTQIQDLWENKPEEILKYGEQMKGALNQKSPLTVDESSSSWNFDHVSQAAERIMQQADVLDGGLERAPKFPVPVLYQFLLEFCDIQSSDKVDNFVKLTLDKMAMGGIYDQIGGGFARYSTDTKWKVPHFEKMLYDNAQLMSLYARAYRQSSNEFYAQIIRGIDTWIEREMQAESGLLFAAQDADSDGVEGLFYTWTQTELEEAGLWNSFKAHYHTGTEAEWEGRIIPIRKNAVVDSAALELNNALLKIREQRNKPATDEKHILSWNALAVLGYFDAYEALGKKRYAEKAEALLNKLTDIFLNLDEFLLSHVAYGLKPRCEGFIEDYTWLISALLKSYTVHFDTERLNLAKSLAMTAIDRYYDPSIGLFCSTVEASGLVSRPIDVHDSVIPSPNSGMVKILSQLAHYFELPHFSEIADRIVRGMKAQWLQHPDSFSMLGSQYLNRSFGEVDVVITGPDAGNWHRQLAPHFHSGFLVAATEKPSHLPIFQNRFSTNKTQVYICQNKTCLAPFDNLEKAIEATRALFPS